MTQRDFPSPPLTTDYRASPEDPPPNVLATQKAGSPHPTPTFYYLAMESDFRGRNSGIF